MKFYVHYTWWNKETHMNWVLDALMYFDDLIIDIVFDNPKDNSLDYLLKHRINNKHKVVYFISDKKLRWPNTNDAIERFMQTDCAVFFSPQDDMKVQDKFIFKNLAALYATEPNVGLVGMRDGVFDGSQYFSSCHSPSGGRERIWLRSGEYKHVEFVNDGPIAVHRNTIKKAGLFSTEYWAHFSDNDYCFRCNALGLKNFVMGAEIVHEKWGKVSQSEVWNKDYSDHDWEVYRRKWPGK